MRLIDKDHMIYRLEQASKYFGGEQTDMFDERFSQGLKEASIKVAEELEIKAIPLSTLQEIRQEIENNMEIIIGKYDANTPKHNRPSHKIERNNGRKECLAIIDKHIKEFEGSDKE